MNQSPSTAVADGKGDEGGNMTIQPLTALDRCDRCGGQAYLRVLLKSGGELLFCAHHAREHNDKLREVADYIHDETHKLEAQEAQPRDAGSTI